MLKLTNEQALRQQHYFDLLVIKHAQAQYQHANNPANAIWIHVTDLQESERIIDLVILLREGLLITRDNLRYPPQGDWRDDFIPCAYEFTPKGLAVMQNPGKWIYKGITD